MKAFYAKGANHVQKVQAQATVLPLAIHVISRSNHQAISRSMDPIGSLALACSTNRPDRSTVTPGKTLVSTIFQSVEQQFK